MVNNCALGVGTEIKSHEKNRAVSEIMAKKAT